MKGSLVLRSTNSKGHAIIALKGGNLGTRHERYPVDLECRLKKVSLCFALL